MNPTLLSQLKSVWYKKENDELMLKRRRRYLHFDPVISSISLNLLKEITNPTMIARHGFLPLIKRDQINRLYKKDPVTKIKRVHKKSRPICYASHKDALIYSWYSCQLEYFYEQELLGKEVSTSVIAYRALGKSNVDFAKEVFDFIKNKGECAVIAFDIKGFYDNLDYKNLKKMWLRMINTRVLPDDHYAIYKSVTKSSHVDFKDFQGILEESNKRKIVPEGALRSLRENKKIIESENVGIPQGTPISCVLSNIYMYELDCNLSRIALSLGGTYKRYCDDMIIVCPLEEIQRLVEIVKNEVIKIKLEIQESKTEIRKFLKQADNLNCFDESDKSSKLQYLGIEFNGQDTLLRHKGLSKYQRKTLAMIKKEVYVSLDKNRPVRRTRIYKKFSAFGKSTYVQYAKNANKKLQSKIIRGQLTTSRIIGMIKKRIKTTAKKMSKHFPRK